MSERLRESLSALMDDEANELEVERLLSRIGDDAELRQTWIRYSRVREALSGQAQSVAGLDISASVRTAIDNDGAKPGTTLRERLWRPVASFAVAASVAATVVLGGQQLVQLSGDEYQDRSSYASNVSPVGLVNAVGATPVRASFGTRPVPVLQPATNEAYRELARQRLKHYSQQHAEQAALNTPQGLIPFARVPRISE
jgi:sigma-E factor negative regulatory protein RseA